MIRYKDKTFEQWSICPVTGDIFDSKTGEVQKITMRHERPEFHGMPVHRIQAYTYYGFKDGYVVHHLDENPLNNMLSNLVLITPSEHGNFHFSNGHHPCLGTHQSPETRMKKSKALKGHIVSEETRLKLRTANTGRKISEETKTKLKGRTPWNKGKSLPKEVKEKIAEATKNAMQNPEVRSKISNAMKGKHLPEEVKQKMRKPRSEKGRANIRAAALLREAKKRKPGS